MKQKRELSELYFEPVISEFKAISEDGNVIKSLKHRVISFEKRFLGIKKAEYNDSTEIFFLKHKESYKLAELLFDSITGSRAQLLNYFHSTDLDWTAFLFFLSDQKNHYDVLYYNDPLGMPENIELVIGVNNGYNEADVPTFYLVLKYKMRNENSFLTIDHFKFNKSEIEEYVSSGKGIGYLEEKLKKEAALQFKDQLLDFISLYRTLKEMTLDKRYFIPVCLDLYNSNRSITSLINDQNLNRRVSNLISQSDRFIESHSNEIDCSLFIDFIIRFNYFPLDNIDINRDKVEELFVQKRAYQKVESIFPSFRKSAENFNEYLNEQFETFNRIKNKMEM